MSRRVAYVFWSVAGAGLTVAILAFVRPPAPWWVQGLIVIAAGLLTVPLLWFGNRRQRKDNELGERLGNGVLERLRKRRDGSSYRSGGQGVALNLERLTRETKEPRD